jgi:di/tripeptidase
MHVERSAPSHPPRRCTVRLCALNLEVSFTAGEEIRTELSAKFTPQRIAADLRTSRALGAGPGQTPRRRRRRLGAQPKSRGLEPQLRPG